MMEYRCSIRVLIGLSLSSCRITAIPLGSPEILGWHDWPALFAALDREWQRKSYWNSPVS
jgi:hypothetical protein